MAREYQRPLMRPDWRAWSDIFASARAVDLFDKPRYESRALHTWRWTEPVYIMRRGKEVKRNERTELTLSSYVSLSGPHVRRSLDVTLTEQVIAAIDERALRVVWDTINLQVNIWDEETLVSYHHSRIIGGSWIAVIDTATIPSAFRVNPPDLELVP